VLCLLSAETESGLIHLVTLREPFRSFETSDTSRPMQCLSNARKNFLSDQLAAPVLGSKIPVCLSDDMLLFELHTIKFEEYLIDVERAGKFYIDPSNYFSQLFDMCVEHCFARHDKNNWYYPCILCYNIPKNLFWDPQDHEGVEKEL